MATISGYDLTFEQGVMQQFTLIIPETLPMTGKKAKIEIRRQPEATVVMTFSTENTDNLLILSGNNLGWTIPAFMTEGKAGAYEWELAVYTSVTDVQKYGRGLFTIESSIVKA